MTGEFTASRLPGVHRSQAPAPVGATPTACAKRGRSERRTLPLREYQLPLQDIDISAKPLLQNPPRLSPRRGLPHSRAAGVSEECFQRGALRFAGNTSWIVDADGRRSPFAMTKVTEGTYPAGSEWARDPVPGCYGCDAYKTCGAPLPPDPSMGKANKWNEQADCYGACDGTTMSKSSGSCPAGTAQHERCGFPIPIQGGHRNANFGTRSEVRSEVYEGGRSELGGDFGRPLGDGSKHFALPQPRSRNRILRNLEVRYERGGHYAY